MDYEWRFYFVIIPDLEAKNTVHGLLMHCLVFFYFTGQTSLQVVREHYGHFAILEATLHIRFEHSEITLGIFEDGLVTKEGWRIIPFTAPAVSQT